MWESSDPKNSQHDKSLPSLSQVPLSSYFQPATNDLHDVYDAILSPFTLSSCCRWYGG